MQILNALCQTYDSYIQPMPEMEDKIYEKAHDATASSKTKMSEDLDSKAQQHA